MGNISVQVGEARVPLDAIARLTPNQRYVYYLLGFIHNESLALRKLITFTRPAPNDRRVFRREPELSQTLLLFRMACCKLWEARLQLNKKDVRDVLVNDVFPFWQEGAAHQRSMNKLAEDANWLYSLRNKLGFHYPSFADWQQFTSPDDTWGDDIAYVGQEAGNQFFVGPEAIVRHQMFGGVDADSQAAKIEIWLRQAVQLLVEFSDFTEQAVGYFTIYTLLGGQRPEIKELGKVNAPKVGEVRVPFWTRRNSNRQRD